MERSRRIVIPALVVFALAFLWLLAGAFARQLQAHALCPGWPECYRASPGVAVPALFAADDIAEAQAAADGALAAALAALAALGWKRRERALDRRWGVPLLALALVASSTSARLIYVGPGVLLWQLLAALAVCALLWWLVLRERCFLRPLPETGVTRALRSRALAGLGFALLAAAFGGWAVAHGIGLPCPDFPACRGQWWPTGSLLATFAGLAPPDLEGAVALTVSHRLAALMALIYVMWLGLHLWRTGTQEHLCRYGLLVFGALLLVVVTGIMGAVTRLPPATAVAHSAAGTLLILSLVTLYHVVRPAIRPGKTRA